MSDLITLLGSCHCGAVTFEVDAPRDVTALDCNCSICAKTGFVQVIVPEARMRVLSGQDALTTYTYNTGVAQHTFCKTCGVKPFYRPRSNPDGYAVNLACIDQTLFDRVTVKDFDGQNWDQNAGSVAHMSKE